MAYVQRDIEQLNLLRYQLIELVLGFILWVSDWIYEYMYLGNGQAAPCGMIYVHMITEIWFYPFRTLLWITYHAPNKLTDNVTKQIMCDFICSVSVWDADVFVWLQTNWLVASFYCQEDFLNMFVRNPHPLKQ